MAIFHLILIAIFILITTENIVAFQLARNSSRSDGDLEAEPEEFHDLVTTFISAFHASSSEKRGEALRQLESRKIWYGGHDDDEDRDMRTVECVCEVTINSRHHVSGEVAVCGMTNRIQCPQSVGCQKAVATTSNGFVSVVKSCGIGNEIAQWGCRSRREQAPYVDRINVLRCICMGRICNGSPSLKSLGLIFTTIVTFVVIGGKYC